MYGSKTNTRFLHRVWFPLIMAVLHIISPAVTIAILILMALVCLLRAAVHLFFAAAKIVHNSISAAHDDLAYDAETMVAQSIVAKEKATKYVKRCTKIDTGGPSLLGFLTNSEKGTSFETLVEAGRRLELHNFTPRKTVSIVPLAQKVSKEHNPEGCFCLLLGAILNIICGSKKKHHPECFQSGMEAYSISSMVQ
ncbi:hypothetical protein Tco_0872833 [Tanacetum coccineum]